MLTRVQEWIVLLLIVSGCALFGNMVGHNVPILDALPGMLILALISLIGLVLAKLIPIKLPPVAYIGIIGMLLTMPAFPLAPTIVEYTGRIRFMALATPILAYAGIAIGKDWADFRKLGWRSIVVALAVLIGTYVGSAVVAEIILRVQGII